MTKSANGGFENPGSDVMAMTGLDKAKVDQGWGELKKKCRHKSIWQGGVLVL